MMIINSSTKEEQQRIPITVDVFDGFAELDHHLVPMVESCAFRDHFCDVFSGVKKFGLATEPVHVEHQA